ncbi:TetR/AcrR family transcriptional regulator [Labrys neptuniae]
MSVEADRPRTRKPAAAKGKRYLNAAEREEQIVEAAIAFVAERGLGFTTRELAESLGITQPLLYRYFSSKQALVERIYQDIYMRRWRPEWNDLLKDRAVPLRERLVTYLKQYTRAILDRNWIRIFLVSALDDPVISQRYLDRLHGETFSIILAEIASETGRAVPTDPKQVQLATEVIWGFHSSFFYLGVRKYIYRREIPEDIDAVIEARVDAFLNGILPSATHFLPEPAG